MAEALLREDSVEFNGERDTVREGDQALQRALKGDQEALGLLLASYMPRTGWSRLCGISASSKAAPGSPPG